MPFVFDTNSLCVLGNYYPARFPTFWERFEDAVLSGEVLSVREVYNELQQLNRKGWLLNWFEEHRDLFLLPTPQEAEFVAEIFRVPHFRMLVGEKQRLKGTPVADPFVIACAYARNGSVISEEVFKPNAAKIPNVCQHFGIDYTDVEGYLARMNWQF
jgi:hypothetical protein